MSDNDQPEDFQHLPTAGGAADAAKRAKKAALWKEVAERKKARLSAQDPVAPESEPQMEEPEAEPHAETAHPAPLHDDWADLLSLDPDAPHEVLPAMQMQAAPLLVETPVEVATRGDVSSRKRSVIRRDAAPTPDSDSKTFTRVLVPAQEPARREEPAAEKSALIKEPAPVKEPPAVAKVSPEPPAREKRRIESRDDEAVEKTPKPETAEEHDAKEPIKEPVIHEAPVRHGLLWEKWEAWGGRSLAISLLVHALLIGTGGFLVVSHGLLDTQVDFLPGGTKQGEAASQELQHKIQKKKSPWLKKVPMQKIVSKNTIADIVLPQDVPDLLDLPQSNNLLTSGKMGGSLGGGGGGFGKSMGLGAKSGMVFQPLSMFGREIKAKRLALILDVSSSMAPFLPRVIEEVDKVARGSIVVLYFGCGLDAPPRGGLDGEELYRTSGGEFERFWRLEGATLAEGRKFKFSPSDPIKRESIYRLLSRRPQTWFIHNIGLGYTWLALLSEQVRQADALYWFSDFQDHVDFQQILTVKENLLRRKQKLYIQPYQHGTSFDLVKSQLVEPSGGDVIEAVFE
jgi:hypothetical protein